MYTVYEMNRNTKEILHSVLNAPYCYLYNQFQTIIIRSSPSVLVNIKTLINNINTNYVNACKYTK